MDYPERSISNAGDMFRFDNFSDAAEHWTQIPRFSGARESPLRILIATDAWKPQVNGVVRTLEMLVKLAPKFGAEISILSPEYFLSVPLPTYPEIPLTLALPRMVAKKIREFSPDAIHIATEGPLGFLTRMHCISTGARFTSCYHTRFPEYLAARLPVSTRWIYRLLKKFHNAAESTLVATESLQGELKSHGFSKTTVWKRGVEVKRFADATAASLDLPRPIFLTVGRIAVEKNVEAFAQLDLPGSKVIVGDGPVRAELMSKYPDCHFLGTRVGAELAQLYAAADAFVFPSLTDTFGLVLLEALSAGTPVAAYPVDGPIEIIGTSSCGVLDRDLRSAAMGALEIPRKDCRDYAEKFSIEESVRHFIEIVDSALVRRTERDPTLIFSQRNQAAG